MRTFCADPITTYASVVFEDTPTKASDLDEYLNCTFVDLDNRPIASEIENDPSGGRQLPNSKTFKFLPGKATPRTSKTI